MTSFPKVANEVLKILQSFDYTVMLYDENGMRVTEPDDARRFFARPNNLMVSLIDGYDSTLELSYGKTTHANDIMGLDLALKSVSTKYSMLFSAKRFGRKLEPKDALSLGSLTEKQERNMFLSLAEGMYGTSRSSYLKLEHAKMIIRHKNKINDSAIGARGRGIDKIFVENATGERLLFPSKQLAPARAMTQHVNNGGSFADEVGKQIMRMTQDYGNLTQGANHIGNHAMNLEEGAMNIREACRGKLRELRKSFDKISKHKSYAAETARVLECSKTLEETAIDEASLVEIRQLLNDADLPREVYECMGKAMSEMNQNTIIETDEEESPMGPWAHSAEFEPGDENEYVAPEEKTVGFFGQRVDKKAWEKLFNEKKLEVTRRPDAMNMNFADPLAKICHILGSLSEVASDVTLANLMSSISYDLGHWKADELRNKSVDRKTWQQKIADMKEVVHAVMRAKIEIKPHGQKTKLKKSSMGGGIPAVAEHFNWLATFSPEFFLAEDFTGLGDWGDPIGDGYDTVKSDVIANFDPDDFVSSPEINELVNGKNSDNPEENKLSHEDVMTALTAYVQRQVEGVGDSFSLYMSDSDEGDDLAESLYDEACEALQDAGWVVEDSDIVESLDDDSDDFELNVEDIMMPTGNQGDSLVHQVSKTAVHDPDHHDDEETPDATYISRMTTLAGVAGGAQSDSY